MRTEQQGTRGTGFFLKRGCLIYSNATHTSWKNMLEGQQRPKVQRLGYRWAWPSHGHHNATLCRGKVRAQQSDTTGGHVSFGNLSC